MRESGEARMRMDCSRLPRRSQSMIESWERIWLWPAVLRNGCQASLNDLLACESPRTAVGSKRGL